MKFWKPTTLLKVSYASSLGYRSIQSCFDSLRSLLVARASKYGKCFPSLGCCLAPLSSAYKQFGSIKPAMLVCYRILVRTVRGYTYPLPNPDRSDSVTSSSACTLRPDWLFACLLTDWSLYRCGGCPLPKWCVAITYFLQVIPIKRQM